jgi:hypothetical protein
VKLGRYGFHSRGVSKQSNHQRENANLLESNAVWLEEKPVSTCLIKSRAGASEGGQGRRGKKKKGRGQKRDDDMGLD